MERKIDEKTHRSDEEDAARPDRRDSPDRRRGFVTTGRKMRFPALLVALGLLLAACGGNSAESTTTQPTSTTSEGITTTTAAATTTTGSTQSPPVSLEGQVNDHGTSTVEGSSIEIEQDNFYFDPTYIEADPGATIEVTLTNEGTASHTFTIDSQGIDVELDSGQSKTVQVTIPDSGSLRFYCRFHVGQGMQGAFFPSNG